jgi:hypothetical protein
MSDDAMKDPTIRRVVWIMVGTMVLSFAFGIAMFVPAEHRAEILAENLARYQARNPDAPQVQPEAKKRIRLSFDKER